MPGRPRGSVEAILNEKGIDWVCDEIAQGKMIAHICRELGVSQSALAKWIAAEDTRSARAREARIQQAAALSEKAEMGLLEAVDQFELSRAKELAHHYRWKASKLDPRSFGDKVQLAGDGGGPVKIEEIRRVIVDPKDLNG